MDDLTSDELIAQGNAVSGMLYRSYCDAIAKLGEAEGKVAILIARCTRLQARVDELSKSPSSEPTTAAEPQ